MNVSKGGGYMMADPTASSSSNSNTTKDSSKDTANDLTSCQVILTDFNKTAAPMNDLIAQQQHPHQPSTEQSLNGNFSPFFRQGMIYPLNHFLLYFNFILCNMVKLFLLFSRKCRFIFK